MPASKRRKHFGQHFLRDGRVIDLILDETFAQAGKTGARGLLEVGPGKGALTNPLLARLPELKALERLLIIEKDDRLSAAWVEQTADLGNVRVLAQDFLKVPMDEIVAPSPLVVVSNLPYSVGTAILTALAAHPEKIPAMILMFQAEVAHRLRAEPGTKSWSSLSIWIQNAWDVKRICLVPPGAFAPPPEVNSEVVLLTARAEPRVKFAPEFEANWEKLLKACFLHRRKMLRSGLPKGSPMAQALADSGLDPELRAEALDWAQWQAFVSAYESVCKNSAR